MIAETVFAALWAYMFCGPWSEPGKVFGWVKAWAYRNLPDWLFMPLIGCAVCHAVWVGAAFQAYRIFCRGHEFEVTHALAIVAGSFGALMLEDFARWREAIICK